MSTTSPHPECLTLPSRLFNFLPSNGATLSRAWASNGCIRAGPRQPDPSVVERNVTLLHELDDQGASDPDLHRRLVGVAARRRAVGIESQQDEVFRNQHPPRVPVPRGEPLSVTVVGEARAS